MADNNDEIIRLDASYEVVRHLGASYEAQTMSNFVMVEGCEIPLRLDTGEEDGLTDILTIHGDYLGTVSEAPGIGFFTFMGPYAEETVKGPFRHFRWAVADLTKDI